MTAWPYHYLDLVYFFNGSKWEEDGQCEVKHGLLLEHSVEISTLVTRRD